MEMSNTNVNGRSATTIIDKYLNYPKAEEHLPELIHRGAEAFFEHDGVLSVSIFLLNTESFDFEHRTTIPYQNKNKMLDIYDQAVNDGNIGKAISLGDSVEINSAENVAIICPLQSIKGVNGIMIALCEKSVVESIKLDKNSFKLWVRLFSSHIENIQLNKVIEKNKALLEQKLAARTMSISQSKRELQAILNSVQTAILIIDPLNNSIVTANPVAAALIGESQDELSGKSIFDYFRDESDEYLYDDQVRFSRNFESTIYSSKNMPIPILRSAATINMGSQTLRIESFFDITERKMNEIALRQANELLELKVQERTEDLQILVHKLRDEISEREKAEYEVRKMLAKEKELSELKTKFVSLVSHEFRTPLTIIRSAAQILERYNTQIDEEQVKEYLLRIVATVDNMTDLMENVLFIGKTDNKKYTYNPRPSMIKNFTEGVIRDIYMTSKSQNEIKFDMNISKDEYLIDESLVRQILINLLTNASKYSGESSPIELKLYEDVSNLFFEVKDYGIGIPEEDQEKIFELFYRGSNVGVISGTGLGMAVVLRSLSMFGGKIDLRSKIGEGTVFKISIPIIGANNE
jgi:PAS domain S-box-containing protein